MRVERQPLPKAHQTPQPPKDKPRPAPREQSKPRVQAVVPPPSKPQSSPLPSPTPQSPAKPTLRQGTTVIHKVLGKGIVTNVDTINGYLHVNFKGVEKLFRYPHIMKTDVLRLP